MAIFAPLVPVTVCAPAMAAVHVAAVQEPFGAIENTVAAVMSPRLVPNMSNPSAV